jgi:hypothetical protein
VCGRERVFVNCEEDSCFWELVCVRGLACAFEMVAGESEAESFAMVGVVGSSEDDNVRVRVVGDGFDVKDRGMKCACVDRPEGNVLGGDAQRLNCARGGRARRRRGSHECYVLEPGHGVGQWGELLYCSKAMIGLR